MGDVLFPSQKIQMNEDAARHFRKKTAYYAAADAKFPVLFFDQHAKMQAGDEVLPGFKPESPRTPGPTMMNYTPRPWEGQSPAGSYPGKCRWTRGGLRGIDIGTYEISTSTWY